MCKNFELTGKCKYGDECSFAHGRHQVMIKSDVSAQYKTKDCKKYAQTGYCPYGSRCQFIHNNKYLPAMQSNSPIPVISNPIDNSLFTNMGAMLSPSSFNKDAET